MHVNNLGWNHTTIVLTDAHVFCNSFACFYSFSTLCIYGQWGHKPSAFGAGFFTKLAQQRGEAQLVGPEGNYYLPKVGALCLEDTGIPVYPPDGDLSMDGIRLQRCPLFRHIGREQTADMWFVQQES